MARAKRCQRRVKGSDGHYNQECGRLAVVKESLLGGSCNDWLCRIHAKQQLTFLRRIELKEAKTELQRQMRGLKSWIKSIKREMTKLTKAVNG